MLKEKHLVKNSLKKEELALEELYKQFAPKMFGVCLRYARNRMDAEDILQDGFIKVFNNLKSFRNLGSIEGWLRRIMINTAINYYKKPSTHYHTNVDTDTMEDNEIYDEDIISDITTKELLSYIRDLPEGYRMVFNLYAIEGYKHKEIGEMLDISENTSKSQLAMAKKVLQEKIKILDIGY